MVLIFMGTSICFVPFQFGSHCSGREMCLFVLVCSGKYVGSFVFSSSSLCLNPFYATDL